MENQKTRRFKIVADACVKIISTLSKIRCKFTCCKSSCNDPPPPTKIYKLKKETML